jgi:hypothetical protein
MKLRVTSFKINQFFLNRLINISIKVINQIISTLINFKMYNTFRSSFPRKKWDIIVKTVLFINNNKNSIFKINQTLLQILTSLNSKKLFG